MKIYKVYSKGCRRARRITEINEIELNEEFIRVVDDAVESGRIIVNDDEENDDWYCNAMDNVSNFFVENNYLEIGDYYIKKADSWDDLEIPNACGWSTGLIFD